MKIKYYYEPKEIKNIIFAENEIFNIPFSIKLFFNEEKYIFYFSINFDLIKLKIENELNLKNKKKFGKSDFVFNQLKRTAEYEIENNYFKFNIFDKVEDPSINYNGVLNFKPFYGGLQGDLNEINLNYLFGTNSIISQLLKTEIFNNKNILFNLNINAENIYNNFNFKNLNLNTKIQEGLIDSDYTKFEWKDFANFELLETLIFVRNGELVLDGKLKVNINNLNEVYKYLLTPKNYRNKINQIDLNFTYNFDKKTAELKDIKIDNKINQNVNKILNNVILKSDNLQNKIYFKNLLNEALKSYAG